jgi:hypothetical protein
MEVCYHTLAREGKEDSSDYARDFQEEGSSAESGESLRLHLFPGNGDLGIRPMGRQPAIHFLALGFRKGRPFHFGRDAVPDFLDQSEPFSDAQFLKTKRELGGHPETSKSASVYAIAGYYNMKAVALLMRTCKWHPTNCATPLDANRFSRFVWL